VSLRSKDGKKEFKPILAEGKSRRKSIEEVMEQFPVTREQIDTLMAFVARSLDKSPTYG
jgi:uncharacterized protein (DUF433 family)